MRDVFVFGLRDVFGSIQYISLCGRVIYCDTFAEARDHRRYLEKKHGSLSIHPVALDLVNPKQAKREALSLLLAKYAARSLNRDGSYVAS